MKFKQILLSAVCLASVLCFSGLPVKAFGEPPRRIHGNIENNQGFVLDGNVSPITSSAIDHGEVEDSFQVPKVTLHFKMSASQQADLESLLKRQQDRTSRDYHRWLTPEQYGARFGMNAKDLEKVTAWLESQGFTNLETARSRTSVSFSGTALQLRNAFSTSLHRYVVDGREHYANATAPALPSALQGMVIGVRGLQDFHPKPRGITRLSPRFTSTITGNHFLAPDDFATIYDLKTLYNNGIDGTGQKIAVVGQTDIKLTDVEAFRQAAGLPANDPQVILDGKDPGTNTDDESEADLDIEWAGAVARQATIIYVNSTDAFTSATYAITNNLAPVLSITYGSCEAQTGAAEANSLSATFQQANAQGITVLAASGDAGAADCDVPLNPTSSPVTSASQGLAVDVPSSIPYVTGLGGTEFTGDTTAYWSATNNSSNGSALSYIPETGWNDTASVGDLSSTGGGKSVFFTKPSWQQGTGVPADGMRDVPDVSLAASPEVIGYLICSAGSCVNGFRNTDTTLNVIGGTSAATPAFAGIVALLNQHTKTTQGNINPNLYSLASISPDAFHDITTGNNQVPCKAGTPDCSVTGVLGFTASTGYDQVTGLGSVDAYNLVNEWGSDFQVAVSPATLTLNTGSSGTAAVNVASVGNFAGTVAFTCSVPATLTNTTCSIPGTVAHSGSTTLTLTNSSASASTGVWNLGRPGTIPPSFWGYSAVYFLLLSLLWMAYPKRRNQALLLGTTIFLAITAVSCGDGSNNSSEQTPSVTAAVTVTATSGIESHTTTLTVTIP